MMIVVTGLVLPRLEPVADALLRPDERDLVGELRRHERDRLVAPAFEEEVLDLVRLGLEAHAAHQLHVEVAVARAHPADVERERGLGRHERLFDGRPRCRARCDSP